MYYGDTLGNPVGRPPTKQNKKDIRRLKYAFLGFIIFIISSAYFIRFGQTKFIDSFLDSLFAGMVLALIITSLYRATKCD